MKHTRRQWLTHACCLLAIGWVMANMPLNLRAEEPATKPDSDQAKKPVTAGMTPREVVEKSIQLTKELKFEENASLILPGDRAKLKKIILSLFDLSDKLPKDSPMYQQAKASLRVLTKPLKSKKEVAAASDLEVVQNFLANIIKSIPDFEEIIRQGEVKILGEVKENDELVFIVQTFLLPRATITPCKKQDGTWYMMLGEALDGLAKKVEFMQYAQEHDLDDEQAFELLSNAKIKEVNVVGHVLEDADTAQVVSRTTVLLGPIEIVQLGVYPIRKGSPEWDLLGEEDREKLNAALKKKYQP
jgi:hypothetical protein